MNIATVKYCDIANGVGVRTTVFVSGCQRHCKECFNPEAWSFAFGETFTPEFEDTILESLEPVYVDGLTLLGGEPMELENQKALAPFLERIKETYPTKSIWLYSGFTFEELIGTCPVQPPYETSPHTPEAMRMLKCLDVLVDGPFMIEKKDISLRFRGSSNQRLLDAPASLARGEAVAWTDDPVFVHGL